MSYLIEDRGQPIIETTTIQEPDRRNESYQKFVKYHWEGIKGNYSEIGKQDKVRILINWEWDTMIKSQYDNFINGILETQGTTKYIKRYGGTQYEIYAIDNIQIQSLTGNIGYKVVFNAHSIYIYDRNITAGGASQGAE